MTQSFETLKQISTQACHERQACTDGFRQMLASENVSQMMATWRDNWQDIVQGRFAEVIASELPALYPSLRSEMNQAGIYFNECPRRAPDFVRVLIAEPEQPVHIYDHARAYIIADSKVVAHDHAHVYNSQYHAEVSLLDFSYAELLQSDQVNRFNFAKLYIRS